jgi:hypothetical protein
MPPSPLYIHATWEDETAAWCVSSDRVPGLRLQADRFADIDSKVRAALGELASPNLLFADVAEWPLVVLANWPRVPKSGTSSS